MKKTFFLLSFIVCSCVLFAQDSYLVLTDSFRNHYIATHGVLKKEEEKKQLRFYPIQEKYKVTASFKPAENMEWFTMKTSGTMKQVYRIYGTITFSINDTTVSLQVLQSQMLLTNPKYKDNLFLPFTDKTTGNETYEVGRYIDLLLGDIQNDKVVIDFNKNYNPYCAYISGRYNCPIPPKANNLPVAITAGEKKYAKAD